MVKQPHYSRLKPSVADQRNQEHTAYDDILGTASAGRNDGRRQTLALMDRGDSGKAPERAGEINRRGPETSFFAEHIGRELRASYQDIVGQPVPDRFLELLNRLEQGTISGNENSQKPEVGD